MRFAWTRSPLHPKWWLGWHLNSVLLLSSAVHGTLLAVIYRTFVDPSGFDAAQLVTQPGTLLLALALRVYRQAARRSDALRDRSQNGADAGMNNSWRGRGNRLRDHPVLFIAPGRAAVFARRCSGDTAISQDG